MRLGIKKYGTRTSRTVTSVIAIMWSIATLVFFNFFSDYMAYYHDGIRESFITPEFVKWLWIHNPLLILSIVGHAVCLVFERYVLRESILIFLALLGVASTAVLLGLFPFDFSVFPDANVTRWTELGLRIALVLTIVSMSFDALISSNTLIWNLVKGTKDY